MSLRRKLVLSIVCVALLTFLLGGALVYFRAIDKIDTEMEAAIAVGTRIAANAVDDVEEITNAEKRFELLVKDFDGDRHLQALVVKPDGTISKRSRLAEPHERIPDWFYRLFAGRDRRSIVPLPTVFDDFGHFELEANARNEISEVWGEAITTLMILSVSTLFISGAVYWIIGGALRPLERLASAFERVGQSSEPNYVAESGPEEFLRVYRAFNRMVERRNRTEAMNRKLHEQLLGVQEEERADIARDLHDDIGPFLFNVDVEAASIMKLRDEGRYDLIAARVTSIREGVRHMQAHVRGILSRLRPAALLDLGLEDALDNLVQSWRLRHPAIEISMSFDTPPLNSELEDTIFRIVQEALNNAVRHGAPGRIDLTVRHVGPSVEVRIADDGRGISDDSARGFGILGMRERVALHDGSLDIKSNARDSGITVTATLRAAQLHDA